MEERRSKSIARYKTARKIVIAVFGFSSLNCLLASFSGMTFLFSSFFSLFHFTLGKHMLIHGDAGMALAFLFASAMGFLPYLFCWIFSKKNYVWMTVATVLFALDLLYLVYFQLVTGFALGFLATGLLLPIETGLHIFALGLLINGLRGAHFLKRIGVPAGSLFAENKEASQAVEVVDSESLSPVTLEDSPENFGSETPEN